MLHVAPAAAERLLAAVQLLVTAPLRSWALAWGLQCAAALLGLDSNPRTSAVCCWWRPFSLRIARTNLLTVCSGWLCA